ncbi:MAG: DUF1501 domain-containing protein [Verrucomicrobiota bacterium]
MNRRRFAATTAWLSPLSSALAWQATQTADQKRPPKSLILLWLNGAPSQLETFDPHPDSEISFGSKAIPTSLPGAQFSENLPHTAEIAENLTIIRSLVSLEGDHSRAQYYLRNGYRLDPALVHPSIGAVLCHECPSPHLEIPSHISILPGQFPGRGGYLGALFDAYKITNLKNPLQDMRSPVNDHRDQRREKGLSVVENAFHSGRLADLESQRTQHHSLYRAARRMMSSEQLAAFQLDEEPASLKAAYGNTPFGLGCLVARRLVEAGVRCVEVSLGGWDTHVNNHELQGARCAILDPAFATLVTDLKDRDLLDSTMVFCGGEFGRTPKLNGLEGRDHWPHAFSAALAGGGLKTGQVLGQTDPTGKKQAPDRPISVADLHYTLQSAFGIDPEVELMTTARRPLALSQGKPIRELL